MAYENKMKPTDADPREFIAAVENKTRRADGETLLEMMREISGEEPVMWGPSIIGFGQHSFRYESGHGGDDGKIGFSPRKANLVLYALTYPPGSEELLGKLGKHKATKGCVYINKLADVDLDVLRELISLTYEYRSNN